MKKVTVRKVGPVRLTSVAASLYGASTHSPACVAVAASNS
jgi:hypothetical protein